MSEFSLWARRVGVSGFRPFTALSVLVMALAMFLPSTARADGPDFALSFSPSPMTIQTRKSGTVTITATTLQGPLSVVNLGCGAVPPNSVCLFKSSTIDLTTAPSGAVDLYLDTSGFAFVVSNPMTNGTLACILLPLPLAGLLLRKRLAPRLRSATTALSFAALAILSTSALQGCSGKLPAATPPGTYTLPISGTSGNVTRTANLTVVVTD